MEASTSFDRAPNGGVNRLAARLERAAAMPAKYAVPAEVVGVGLLIAVVGMYWDIGTHIDQGRDETLFTISHSLIVIGIAICVFGAWLSMVIPGPVSRGALRFGGYALPAGGLILMVCGAIALLAFPLDDVWHRMFGEDVTLWSPSHMLMIGGASLCALGIIVLAFEGSQARGRVSSGRRSVAIRVRQYLGCGGLLVALSTLQAEFDYGVPQFQLLFAPIMITIAAAIGLVFARAMLGPFGAVGAVAGFLAIRGALALIVGAGLDHTVPHFPLYMVSAVVIELVALIRWRSAAGFGAAAGLAAGTVGLASEWGWSHVFMPHPWTASILPDAVVLSVLAGVAGGIVGARIAAAVGAEFQPPLQRNRKTTALVALSILTLVATLAVPLPRSGDAGVRATIVPFDTGRDTTMLRITMSQPDYSKNAEWFEVFSWQGNGSKQVALRQLTPTTYVTTAAVPYGGNWKSMLRAAHGSKLVGAPAYIAAEPLTGKPAIPLKRRTVPMERDTRLLMRESKQGVGGLLTPAYIAVGLIAVGWMVALAFALSRAEGPAGGGRSRNRGGRRGQPAPQH